MKWTKDGARIPIKSWCEQVESGAMKQAENLAAIPVTFKHVALMPDCHVGYGMPIGGVIACQEAVIPNAVGVDIGCGMIACKTTLTAEDLPDNLAPLRSAIERAVPHGRAPGSRDPGAWQKAPEIGRAHV